MPEHIQQPACGPCKTGNHAGCCNTFIQANITPAGCACHRNDHAPLPHDPLTIMLLDEWGKEVRPYRCVAIRAAHQGELIADLHDACATVAGNDHSFQSCILVHAAPIDSSPKPAKAAPRGLAAAQRRAERDAM